MRRRHAIITLAAASAAASGLSAPRRAGAAAAERYPDRPVSLIIGYAPGGLTDVMVRLIAERLGRELGQPVVVENRTGAATAVASTAVATARPDGHALLIGTNSLAINIALTPGATPRDPLRELEPVGPVYYSPFGLLVHRDVPAADLPSLLALARARPEALNYGSSGTGSVNHLLTELLLQRTGARMVHVPYRGAGPALLDLRAGRIQAFYATPLDARPLLAEGVARMLAISAAERLPGLPEVPSVREFAEGCDGVLWQGLFAPAGTPAPVIARLHRALRAVLDDPSLAGRVADQGVALMRGGAAELRDLLRAEIALWPRVIREAGIVPD